MQSDSVKGRRLLKTERSVLIGADAVKFNGICIRCTRECFQDFLLEVVRKIHIVVCKQKDITGGMLFNSEQAWVTKPAERGFGKEAGNLSWEIQTASGELTE